MLLGSRQAGKTTLAFQVAQPGGVYQGLKSPQDRNRLSNGTSSNGLYLLLGSASLNLIQHSSENLTDRIALVELSDRHPIRREAAGSATARQNAGAASATASQKETPSLPNE